MIPLQSWRSLVGDEPAVALKPGQVWQVGAWVLKRENPFGAADPRSRLMDARRILTHLAAEGNPVSVPVLTDDHEPAAEHDGDYYTLSPHLPGNTEAGTLIQLKCLGAGIAKLHQALDTCPTNIHSWEIHLAERTFGESWPLLEVALPAADSARLSEAVLPVREGMVKAFEGLPSQRIHGDCHAGNILFVGDELTGFIDLDHLPIGPRTYDLGYYLSCGITYCTDQGEHPTDALNRLGPPLFAGYESVSRLSDAEWEAIVPIMLSVQLTLAGWYFRAGNQNRADRSLNFVHWLAGMAGWTPA